MEDINYSNGDRYVGEIVDGKRNGKGKFYFANGFKYEGDFCKGKIHGKGVFYYNDESFYEGDFVNNERHGKGVITFSNGEKYDGDWENDYRTGRGKYYYVNGDIYDGNFLDGRPHGQGEMKYANGEKYVGNFCHEVKQGMGTYYYTNGYIYSGYFYNDFPDGQGKLILPNGDIKAIIFKNSLQEEEQLASDEENQFGNFNSTQQLTPEDLKKDNITNDDNLQEFSNSECDEESIIIKNKLLKNQDCLKEDTDLISKEPLSNNDPTIDSNEIDNNEDNKSVKEDNKSEHQLYADIGKGVDDLLEQYGLESYKLNKENEIYTESLYVDEVFQKVERQINGEEEVNEIALENNSSIEMEIEQNEELNNENNNDDTLETLNLLDSQNEDDGVIKTISGEKNAVENAEEIYRNARLNRRNKELSNYLYYKAAILGHEKAINFLKTDDKYARFYYFRYLQKVCGNNKKTIKALVLAAEEKHVVAQFILANYYAQGTILKQNFKQALNWYKKVIRNRSSNAYLYAENAGKLSTTIKNYLKDKNPNKAFVLDQVLFEVDDHEEYTAKNGEKIIVER